MDDLQIKAARELEKQATTDLAPLFAERGASYVLTGIACLLEGEGMLVAAALVRSARGKCNEF